MVESNDKLDEGEESNAGHQAADQDEAGLDAGLLEAAQRWAEEFNPSLGADPREEDFSLESTQAEEPRRKGRRKKAHPPSELEPQPVQAANEAVESPMDEDDARPPSSEALLSAVKEEVEDIDDVEALVAHFNAAAEQRMEEAADEAGDEAAAAEHSAEDLAPTPKKPRARKREEDEASEHSALESVAAFEAEIFTDDKQGLMRWDEAINLEAQVEAILFAAPKPISVSEVAEFLADDDGNEPDHSLIDAIVQQLQRLYKERNGGFRLEYDKGAGFQFRTVPAAAPIMERMFSSRQRPLSRAAHETLAIIAYRQPCTRADIEFIRGVDAGSIIKNLLERDLVACVGRKEDSGRPMLFGTTAEFMRVFRIQSLNDLPPLSAFQPASEAIIDAFQKIERPDADVDIEDFIGDESLAQPEISGGIAAEFTKSTDSFEVREDGSESSAVNPAEVRRYGGIFDNEGFLSDGYENTEVALPTRDSITPGSGEDSPRGPDQHQRKSGARARDEDPT